MQRISGFFPQCIDESSRYIEERIRRFLLPAQPGYLLCLKQRTKLFFDSGLPDDIVIRIIPEINSGTPKRVCPSGTPIQKEGNYMTDNNNMKKTFKRIVTSVMAAFTLIGCGLFSNSDKESSDTAAHSEPEVTIIEQAAPDRTGSEPKRETHETPSVSDTDNDRTSSVMKPAGTTAGSTAPVFTEDSTDRSAPSAVSFGGDTFTPVQTVSAGTTHTSGSTVVVLTPVAKENEKILAAAAELAAAGKRLKSASEAYRIASENCDKVTKELADMQAALGDENVIEAAKIRLGKAQAILEIAEAAKAQAEAVLESVRSEYLRAIAEANTDFTDAKAETDAAYAQALSDAEDTYNRAVQQAEDTFRSTSERAGTALQSAKDRHDTSVAAIRKSYEEAVTSADSRMTETVKHARDVHARKTAEAEQTCADSKTAAQAAYDTAVANAKAEYDAAVQAAQEAYDTAIAEIDSGAYDTARASYEAALSTQKELAAAESDAKSVLDNAQSELDELRSKKQDSDNAVAAAQAKAQAAEAALRSANDDLARAQTAVRDAESGSAAAQRAVETAQRAVEEAEAARTQAVSELETARNGRENADYDAMITAAQQRVADAEAALQAAQDQIILGSYGFFKDQGAEEACAVIELMMSDRIEEGRRIVLDAEHDASNATNLDNMKRAIDLIEEGNELRTTDDNFTGLKPLVITNTMMAIAQANTEHQKNAPVMDHWANEDGGLAQFNPKWGTYENIAGSFRDPFDAWYGQEKAEYESGNDDYLDVGHYLNLTNFSLESTGLAVGYDSYGRKMYVQDFESGDMCYMEGYGWYKNYLKQDDTRSFTVDEYRALFMDYYNRVMSAKQNAESELAAAKADLSALQNSSAGGRIVDPAEVAAAEAKLSEAESRLSAADAVLSEAQIACGNTEVTLSDARKALSETETSVSAAQETLDIASAELTETEVSAETLNNEIVIAETAVSEQTQVYEDARTAAENGTQAVADTAEVMEAEKAALDAQVSEEAQKLEDAKNSTTVQDAEAAAETELKRAETEAEAVRNKAVEAAGSELRDAQQLAEDTRSEAVAEAETVRDEAVRAEDDLLAEAESAYSTAVSEAESARSTAIESASQDRTQSVQTAETAHTDAVNGLTQKRSESLERIEAQHDKAAADAMAADRKAQKELDEAENDAEDRKADLEKCTKLVKDTQDAQRVLNESETELQNAQAAYDSSETAYKSLSTNQ